MLIIQELKDNLLLMFRQLLFPFMRKMVYVSQNINSTCQLYENACDVFIKSVLQKNFLNFLLTLWYLNEFFL